MCLGRLFHYTLFCSLIGGKVIIPFLLLYMEDCIWV
nr:MAG TPA_asm: hypothetical protein [Bacteriophage sp.]